MRHYDPEVAPDPAEWLALDEGERIQLAEAHHRKACIKLPNVRLHAAFHTIVENRIAEGLDSVVRAMARLMTDGLSRHDALRAIASLVTEHVYEAMNTKDEEASVRALAAYMEGLPGKRYIAEILLSWVGEEGEKPPNQREISLGEIRRKGFRFRSGEILRVRAGVKE